VKADLAGPAFGKEWETEGGATEDGPQTPKAPHDANQLAKSWTLPPAKSMTVNLRGGNKAKTLAPSLLGGKAQAASMTPMRRAQIAKAAAKSRWNKR
jgi:hypothetical protein